MSIIEKKIKFIAHPCFIVNMGRRAASDKEKVTSIVKDFSEDFICTPNFKLYCLKCKPVIRHDKRFFVNTHRRIDKHKSKTVNLSFQQQFLQERKVPDFTDTLVCTFLALNIPLKKLRTPAMQSLFFEMGHPVPSESCC